MKREPTKLSKFDRIELAVIDEIKSAKDHVSETESDNRIKRWDRYYGRPLGNEKPGRSRFISKDIMETVEWILPSLLSTFVSEDPKIELSIEGQPAVVGRALMQKIQEDLNDDNERSMYLLFYIWFKDALVSDTAFVVPSWEYDSVIETSRLAQASLPQMQQLQQIPGAQLTGYTDNFNGTYSDVEVEHERVISDRLKVENIPHWDVLVEKNAKYINDEYGKGYKAEVTLDYLYSVNDSYGEDFFRNLDKLRLYLHNKDTGSTEDGGEKSSYYSYLDTDEMRSMLEDLGDKLPSLKTVVSVVQWYTMMDIDGDGRLESIRCWVADEEVLLRYEENTDEAVMLCALSPIIDCYKMFGIAYSELIMDLQNLKTMLMRRILDNFDFSTLGRIFVRPGGRVPIKELLQGVPGDALMVDPNNVHVEYPKPFDSRVLDLINYIDQTKESRTGSTKANQGTDAEAVNRNVGGLIAMQTASQKRIDMIGRLFAETGLRDLYTKCVTLFKNNLKRPFTVKVEGTEVTITPQQIQGRVKCKTNLGIETQIGMMEAQRIQGIFSFLVGVNQIFPGIVGPQQIHKLAVDYVTNLGKKQPEDYVVKLQEFVQNLQVSQQQIMQAKQMQDQMQQEELRQGWAKIQVAAAKNDVDLKEIMANFEGRMSTKAMDIQQSQRSDTMRFITELMKIKGAKDVNPQRVASTVQR